MSTAQLITALGAFGGTTIDDLVVLALLFAARGLTGQPRARAIVAGQYAGFAAVLAVALAVAAGLHIVPIRWIGLLGLAPLGFGVHGLWRLRRADPDAPAVPTGTAAGIAALTFADGADNITVFAPLFRGMDPAVCTGTAGMFLGLVGLWCAAGALLGGHGGARAALARVAHWLVPVVFVGIGLCILTGSGTVAALCRAL